MGRFSFGRRTFGVVVLATTLFACGKSSGSTGPSGGAYYFRFDANGAHVNYTSQPSLVASFGHAGSQYNSVVTGFTANSNANVQLFSGSPITQATYSGYAIVGTAFAGALIGYQDASGTVYVSGTPATDAVVTVSQLTTTTLHGIFSGRLHAAGHADIVVTNGEFFVRRAN